MLFSSANADIHVLYTIVGTIVVIAFCTQAIAVTIIMQTNLKIRKQLNFVIYPIVVLAMSKLKCLRKFLLLSILYRVYFLFINQICEQKPAIHVSLVYYCDHRIVQITAPFCCFAANHNQHITLIFQQQRMTVIGDAFFMTIVSGNSARHSVATPPPCTANRLHTRTIFKCYDGPHAKLHNIFCCLCPFTRYMC